MFPCFYLPLSTFKTYHPMKRKAFIHGLLGSSITIPVFAQNNTQDKPAPLNPEVVKAFVGASHGNISKVKEIQLEHPSIVYAAHDWGGGDFETGLEAAGHVGNVEITEFLLEKGARMTIFCMTMLGKTDQVKSVLTAFPALLNTVGPHGFTLLHHAKVGGEHSKELYEYILSKGLKDTQRKFW